MEMKSKYIKPSTNITISKNLTAEKVVTDFGWDVTVRKRCLTTSDKNFAAGDKKIELANAIKFDLDLMIALVRFRDNKVCFGNRKLLHNTRI